MVLDLSHLEKELTAKLLVPIECEDSSARISCRPAIFQQGHGFSFDCSGISPTLFVASLQLDSFGVDIVDAWRNHHASTAQEAFAFLASLKCDISVLLRANGARLSTADEIAAIPDEDLEAASTRLRLTLQIEEKSSVSENIATLLFASLGFSLILADAYANLEKSEAPESNTEAELEGAAYEATSVRYERSRKNRMRCIAAHGDRCYVCGFDFGKAYGTFAEGFIEVHHRTPVSTLSKETKVDPVKDLVPLCANCHRAVHITTPPMDPDELKEIVGSRK